MAESKCVRCGQSYDDAHDVGDSEGLCGNCDYQKAFALRHGVGPNEQLDWMDDEVDAEAIYTRGLRDGIRKGLKANMDVSALNEEGLEKWVEVLMKNGRPE